MYACIIILKTAYKEAVPKNQREAKRTGYYTTNQDAAYLYVQNRLNDI